MRSAGTWLLTAVALGLLLCSPPAAAAPSEYDLKAALVFNFLSFVEWPAGRAEATEAKVCVLGSHAFGEAMGRLQGRVTGGRTVAVREITDPGAAAGCHAVFLGASGPSPEQLAAALSGRGVLTLADTEGFGARGIAINFFIEDSRVRFEANLAALQNAGVRVSSKMLRLARLVGPGH